MNKTHNEAVATIHSTLPESPLSTGRFFGIRFIPALLANDSLTRGILISNCEVNIHG